jgi:transcriptional regulator with XRE-family HTH domain
MNPMKELQARLKQRKSTTALAADLGVSDSYLRDVLKDRRPASDRLLNALGLERVTIIRRKRKD